MTIPTDMTLAGSIPMAKSKSMAARLSDIPDRDQKEADEAAQSAQSTDPAVWVEEHGDYLFSLALSRVRSKEVAEDIVQDTLLSAVRSIDGFEGRSSVRTWLSTILKNKAIDYLRKTSREQRYQVDVEDPENQQEHFNQFGIWNRFLSNWARSPEKALEDRELHAVLEKCIRKLPEKSRRIFIMKTLDQVDTEEVCETLGVSSSNVWVLMHRARMKLRDCIELNWANA